MMDITDDGKQPPIEPQDYGFGVKVIDFGDARVARGLSRRPYSACRHRQLVYDDKERRIWCKDCEHNVEHFEAFKVLVENSHAFISHITRREREVAEAEQQALHLIATKNLEKTWRGRTMAVACPHCRGGLLPDDFKNIGTCTSAELELQRRKKTAQAPQTKESE